MIAVAAMGITGTFALADDSFNSQTFSETVDRGLIYGHVEATLYDEFGNVKAYTQSDNTIVDVGLDMILNNLIEPPITGISNATLGDVSHMQIGTATVEAGATNSTIDAISGCITTAITASSSGTGVVLLEATFTVGINGSNCGTAIGEAGLFDGATGSGSDSLFAQNKFASTVPLGVDDSLDIDWTFTFTDN